MIPLSLLGQRLMLGVRGESLLEEERELVRRLAPGGFILFRENLGAREQARALVEELTALAREASGIPPVIAIDEEGGFLCHTARLAAPFPAAAALAAAGEPELPRAVAECVGHRLRHLGIGLDLAPVLDVNDRADNPVIGPRSFGSDPDAVARGGIAVIEGLAAAGVLSAGKHFPGHGSTALDSHRDLPALRHDASRLERVELRPYRAALAAGLPAVLTAHVAYPEASGCGDLPATFCPFLLRATLRDRLGFREGVILSDDLGMGAVREHFSPEETAALGLRAGLDVFLFARDPSPAVATWHALRDALDQGGAGVAECEASVARVLQLKRRWLDRPPNGTWGDPLAWRDGARDWDENEERLGRLTERAAAAAVGRVAGDLPRGGFLRGSEPWGLIAAEAVAGAARFRAESALRAARALPGFRGAAALDASAPGDGARDALARGAQWERVVLLEAHRRPPAPAFEAFARELLSGARPVAWVSLLVPWPLAGAASPAVRLRSWGMDDASLRAVFACLAGQRAPGGADPFASSGP